MYESFYGFREKPFSLIPDPDFLYLSRLHKAALNMLEYGLRGEAGFTLISGEVGSGKTILVRRFLKMVDKDTTVGLITNTHSSIGNLLEWILLAFGLDYRGMEKVELYHVFSEFLNDLQAEGRRAILIIDEAQNMELDTLEELRMLSNINADKNLVLQIVLVGQPEILEKLNRPEMRQMTQRISVTFRLWPLTFAETCGYVRHRVKVAGGHPGTFDDSACGAIYHFTEGLPRPINILCDAALVYGFGEGKRTVDIDTILDVIDDRQRSGLQPFSRLDKEFDRAALVETISELVETYGTPEMLEEAASLPSAESSFVADDDDHEEGNDADRVAPFVDRGGYDDIDDDSDTHPPERAGEQAASRYHDPDEAEAFAETVGDADDTAEDEEDWQRSAYERPVEQVAPRRGGFGRWVAIIALVCVGLAAAVFALPYLDGTSKSSENEEGGDLIAGLVEQVSEQAAPDAAADTGIMPESEASQNGTGVAEADAEAGDEVQASSTSNDGTASGQPEEGLQTASRPISVEVLEYVSPPDEAPAAETFDQNPEEIAPAAEANRPAPTTGPDDATGDVTGEATGDAAAESPAGQEEVASADSAVQRASQDLLRLSGLDGAAVLGDGGIEFSSVRGDLTGALGALFSEWTVDYSSAQGTSPCGKALRKGLRCFEATGGWDLIGQLNRPALISLDAPDGRQIHGVLSALDGDKGLLVIDGREHLVGLDQLAPYWGGEFLLLWRPPAVYRRLLREGLRGDDVVWLRNQLATVNGSSPSTQDAIIFDQALKNEVIAFQRQRGLRVDGLVGSETLVHLGSVNSQAGEPVLGDRVL